ncbi:D-alanyl-D-alanine carboxypeptidase [Oenococcus oeni ATCC BAA-1163]|uniref:D-alanyl-D-alanine carboxypeptidase n=2 Tax=Oenococcus oeni TaxID=1247 RepID=A0NJG8_OENOE|nr:D-alanyl-D-alanine carboxypeptidase [Oenococcus oeni ATCC BAA-1163]
MIKLSAVAQSSLFAELNGKIISKKNVRKTFPISDLSRLVLIYEVLSAIRSKKISLDTPLIVSEKISLFSKKDRSAAMHFQIGEFFTVKQAIEILLIMSEKSAAYLLIEKIFGNLEKWRSETARFLKQEKIDGLIYEPVGLMSGEGRENLLSAISILKVINKLVNDFPKILAMTQKKQFIFQSDRQVQFYRNPSFKQRINNLQISAFFAEKYQKSSNFISDFKIKDKLYLSELLAGDNTFFNGEETADALIDNQFLEDEKQLWQE